jgi:hypothetical protein
MGLSDDTQTSTSTSSTAPTNPAVTATTNNLLGKLDTATNAGVPVFDKSLFAGAGPTTIGAQDASLAAAGNPDYASGVSGAIKSFGNTAAGNDFGMNDPGYARLRQNAIDDALKNVGAGFTASGRFGGGSYTDQATKSAFDAASGLDYANYQNDITRQQQAAALLPSLYGAAQQPSATMGAVGAAQDANSQGALLGENDRFQRKNGNLWDTLGRASSILAGTAGASGNTTTNSTTTPTTPWWQSLGGLGISAAGAFL